MGGLNPNIFHGARKRAGARGGAGGNRSGWVRAEPLLLLLFIIIKYLKTFVI